MIQPNDQRAPVEILCEEFLQRWRAGEAPAIEEYAQANQMLRDEIYAVFPAMLAMENVKEDRSRESSFRPIQLQVDRLHQLGDYRIIREIGRGGMAIVYEAEQQSLHRHVAVKVFPEQAFDDSNHLKRFQREAKTIGCLHHNNIVPVFGIGQQDGLHYFVMQLLDGNSLDHVIRELRDYSNKRAEKLDPLQQIIGSQQERTTELKASAEFSRSPDNGESTGGQSSSIRAEQPETTQSSVAFEVAKSVQDDFFRGKPYWRRIAELGRQVAVGLQYAHQQGVLHRDIKPSNLVIDQSWRVWITDFGLATCLSHDRLSQTGDIVGTLRYMAPERLSGQSDVRSDIYSLGLTIYELATLQPAFDANSRGKLTRQVLHGSPPAPRQILSDFPPDLETIILKAISREPKDRYQSAAQFAADLKNFCEDRPILARRASKTEHLKRWMIRNPVAASLSSALLLCIAVSLITVTAKWHEAVREKSHAQTEGARAENNLTLALESMDRFLQKFEADWMAHPIAPDTEDAQSTSSQRFVVSDRSAAVLQEALSFYEEFAKQNASNPRLKRDTARAYLRAGGIHERLGQLGLAEVANQKAVDLLATMQLDPQDVESRIWIANAHNRLAMVLTAQFRHRESLSHLLFAKTSLKSILVNNEQSVDGRYELALTNSHLGSVLWWLRDGRQAAQRHRNAIVLLEALVDEHPKQAKYRLALARTYGDYYHFAANMKDRTYSFEIRNAAAEILEELVADHPDVPDYRCELSEMLTMHGTLGGDDDQRQLEQLSKAVDLAAELVVEFPTIPRYRSAWARALSKKASILQRSSPSEAIELHTHAVSIYAALSETYPKFVGYRAFHARFLKGQAQCLQQLERIDEARRVCTQAVTAQREYLDNYPESLFGKKWLADYLRLQSTLERQAGMNDAAQALEKEADRCWKQRSASN